jgi:hypothetical protein
MNTQRYGLTILLSVLLTGAIGFIGWETDWGRALRGEAPTPIARAATLDTKVPPPYRLPPVEPTYKELVERPLFLSARRPAPLSNATPQVVMKKGQFKLAGTSVSQGLSIAYLVETSTNKTHRVNAGDEINGIKVERVEATRIVMKQGDDSEELTLRSATSPKLPPTQVAAVGVPGQPGMQGLPGQPGQLPGAPGGNFGPPLPPGQMQGQMQGQVAGVVPGQAPQMAPGFNPNQAQAAVPPQIPGQVNPNGEVTPPPDPNAVQMRRRRFQNLPQN